MGTIRFNKEGGVVADLVFGMGTVTQARGVQEAINGSHIPYDGTKSLTEQIDLKATEADVDDKLALKADLNGSTGAVFNIATGVASTHAITKAQFDSAVALLASLSYVDAQLLLKADKTNVLELSNVNAFSPTSDYQPSTKKYVDDTLIGIGAGDMTKAVYDNNNDGYVDSTAGIGKTGELMGISTHNQVMRLSQSNVTDCNTLSTFGIFVGNDVANSPQLGLIGLEQLQIGGSKAQRCLAFSTRQWYYRDYNENSTTWSTWNIMDGSDRVSKSGDTMLGNLTLKAQAGATRQVELTRPDDTVAGQFIFDNDSGELRFRKLDLDGTTVLTEMTFTSDGNVRVNGLAPTFNSDITRKDYVDTADTALQTQITENRQAIQGLESTNTAGVMFDWCIPTPPNGSLECDGSEYSESVFSVLFAVIGHTWDRAGGQDAPTVGYFRVPISQDLLLFNPSEYESTDEAKIGTYKHNTILGGALAPVKCIVSGKDFSNKSYSNDDFFANGETDTFGITASYSNTDFLANVANNVGFGNELEYTNGSFVPNMAANVGFAGEVMEYTNGSFVTNMSSNVGFAGSETAFNNSNFSLNESSNVGFTY